MVYEPLDDSFLLQKWVAKLSKDKEVLDMGTGNGIQAITAFENGAKRVVAVDIDPKAIDVAKANAAARGAKIRFIVSDLFSKVDKDEKFDLIIFNPPYLPYSEDLPNDIDLVGGKVGNELSIRFLKEAKNFLKEGGFVLLICSSISEPYEIFSTAKEYGYDVEVLEDETINMETLYCVKFTPHKII